MNRIVNAQNNVNPYDIYRWCWHEVDTPAFDYARWSEKVKLRANPDGIPCVDTLGSTAMWNDAKTRAEFNLADSTVHWSTCVAGNILHYDPTPGQSYQWYPALIKEGYEILIYSGDTDSVVPFTGTMGWIHQLVGEQGYKKTDQWREWMYGGQVAGYT
jgi:serine carboxypeptidase-like clade 1